MNRLRLLIENSGERIGVERQRSDYLVSLVLDKDPSSISFSEIKISPSWFYQISGAVTTKDDLTTALFADMLNSEQKMSLGVTIGIKEVLDWEKISKRLKALEAVVGLLDDFTPEQLIEFEKSTKRRPLFEK